MQGFKSSMNNHPDPATVIAGIVLAELARDDAGATLEEGPAGLTHIDGRFHLPQIVRRVAAAIALGALDPDPTP
mgnify:FL=1